MLSSDKTSPEVIFDKTETQISKINKRAEHDDELDALLGNVKVVDAKHATDKLNRRIKSKFEVALSSYHPILIDDFKEGDAIKYVDFAMKKVSISGIVTFIYKQPINTESMNLMHTTLIRLINTKYQHAWYINPRKYVFFKYIRPEGSVRVNKNKTRSKADKYMNQIMRENIEMYKKILKEEEIEELERQTKRRIRRAQEEKFLNEPE
jgi:hypothetical protein